MLNCNLCRFTILTFDPQLSSFVFVGKSNEQLQTKRNEFLIRATSLFKKTLLIVSHVGFVLFSLPVFWFLILKNGFWTMLQSIYMLGESTKSRSIYVTVFLDVFLHWYALSNKEINHTNAANSNLVYLKAG